MVGKNSCYESIVIILLAWMVGVHYELFIITFFQLTVQFSSNLILIRSIHGI